MSRGHTDCNLCIGAERTTNNTAELMLSPTLSYALAWAFNGATLLLGEVALLYVLLTSRGDPAELLRTYVQVWRASRATRHCARVTRSMLVPHSCRARRACIHTRRRCSTPYA